MRHARRGRHAGVEFGGSGEDSFVAVVVTKLTGALLFILLLAMVIMALIPRAVPSGGRSPEPDLAGPTPLRIDQPELLPEAIAGRPYAVALAASGGRGPRRWSVEGPLPEGLSLDANAALLHGTPRAASETPARLVLRVADEQGHAAAPVRLVVLRADAASSQVSIRNRLATPSLHRWLEQGFGFLVLGLVWLLALSVLASAERWALAGVPSGAAIPARVVRRRFLGYRITVCLAAAAAAAALAVALLGIAVPKFR
jgi:hypothetical protein